MYSAKRTSAACSGISSSTSDPGESDQETGRRSTTITHRLFIYGSLQPGGPNEHVLTDIGGEFAPAVIHGQLIEQGWGAALGYPGLVLGQGEDEIHGHVFTSPCLHQHWATLDEFEGPEYSRVVSTVTLTEDERVDAWVYVLSGPATNERTR